MAISEPVRSLETHKLMPGDIYPHPAMGEAYSDPNNLLTD